MDIFGYTCYVTGDWQLLEVAIFIMGFMMGWLITLLAMHRSH